MSAAWVLLPSAVAVIGCAMVAGLFFTFSDFLMRSFHRADAVAGIEVMQILNREIFRSVTMVLLWGMMVLTGALALYGFFFESGFVADLFLAGAASYLVGVFAVSFAFNIPMNERLDAMDHRNAEAAAYWQIYVKRWTSWNYARAFASVAWAACFLVAGLALAQA